MRIEIVRRMGACCHGRFRCSVFGVRLSVGGVRWLVARVWPARGSGWLDERSSFLHFCVFSGAGGRAGESAAGVAVRAAASRLGYPRRRRRRPPGLRPPLGIVLISLAVVAGGCLLVAGGRRARGAQRASGVMVRRRGGVGRGVGVSSHCLTNVLTECEEYRMLPTYGNACASGPFASVADH